MLVLSCKCPNTPHCKVQDHQLAFLEVLMRWHILSTGCKTSEICDAPDRGGYELPW